MNKFLIGVAYSSGSWARMLNSADDRTAAVRRPLASLGGSLAQVYWIADMRGAFAIAESYLVPGNAAVA